MRVQPAAGEVERRQARAAVTDTKRIGKAIRSTANAPELRKPRCGRGQWKNTKAEADSQDFQR
jgi:hypothetical protein